MAGWIDQPTSPTSLSSKEKDSSVERIETKGGRETELLDDHSVTHMNDC